MKSKSAVSWGKTFFQPGSRQILRSGMCYIDSGNKEKLFFNDPCEFLQIQDILWFYKHCHWLINISLFLRRGSPALPILSWKSAYCHLLRETSTALSFLQNFPSHVKNENYCTQLCPGRVALWKFGAKKGILTSAQHPHRTIFLLICLRNENISENIRSCFSYLELY